jgi:hypothetical protein
MVVTGLRDFGPVEGLNATGMLAEKLGIEADTVFRDAIKQGRDKGLIDAQIDGRRTKRLAAAEGNGQTDGEEFGEFDAGTSTVASVVAPVKVKAKARVVKGNGRKRGRPVATTPYAEALHARKAEIQAKRDELNAEMDALNDEDSMIDDLLSRAK